MIKRPGYLLIPIDLLLLFLTYRLAFVLREVAISSGILTRAVADPYPTMPHHALFLIVSQLLALWIAGLYNTSNWQFGRSFFRTGGALSGQALALTIYTLSQNEILWLIPVALFWGLNTTAVALLRGVVGTILFRLRPPTQETDASLLSTEAVELLEAVLALLNAIRELQQERDEWASALNEALAADPEGTPRTAVVCAAGYNQCRRNLALKRLDLTRSRRHLEELYRRSARNLKRAEEELESEHIKQSLLAAPNTSDDTLTKRKKEAEELRQRVHHAEELMTLCLRVIGTDRYSSWAARWRVEVGMRFEAMLFRWVHLPLIHTYKVVDFFLKDSSRVFIGGFMTLLMVCAGLLSSAPLASGVVRWWAGSHFWITDLGPIGNLPLPSGKTLNQRLVNLKDESFRNSLEAGSVIRFPIEWLTEQVANIAYLLLIIGVGIRLYQFFKGRNNLPDKSGGL